MSTTADRALVLDVELRRPTIDGEYLYTVIYELDGWVIRCGIRIDSYVHQSHAIAAVLSPSLEWTVLVDAEPPRREPVDNDRTSGLSYLDQAAIVCEERGQAAACNLLERVARIRSATPDSLVVTAARGGGDVAVADGINREAER